MNKRAAIKCGFAVITALLNLTASTYCQTVSGYKPNAPLVVSPELSPDGHIAFRIFAANARTVRLIAKEIPGGSSFEMTKGTNGVWERLIGPVDPGAYRYSYDVDDVAVIDPANHLISESNNHVSSLVYVPGSEFMDTKNVPHGSVSTATYYSTALEQFRRMHVYTPPGYELGKGKFPVLYLLHGAGDNDDAWTSIGRAGFILDNLIAAKKASPMIIVMPAGHTTGGKNGFIEDFLQDIMPYTENNYRVFKDSRHRAIAGLSMGGAQTLNIAIPHLEEFGYIGIFSSGILGIVDHDRGGFPTTTEGQSWEVQHAVFLDNPKPKKGLQLFWFGSGKDDFLLETTKATMVMFEKHGFKIIFHESSGGHTWINWRNYLDEFAPLLFR